MIKLYSKINCGLGPDFNDLSRDLKAWRSKRLPVPLSRTHSSEVWPAKINCLSSYPC